MKLVDKLLLFLYLIVLTAIFLFIIVIPTGYIPEYLVNTILEGIRSVWYYQIAAAAFIVINIRLMASLFSGDGTQKFGVVKLTPEGEINISNDTIKSLVLRTSSQVRGVRDVKVFIRPAKDKINIYIRLLIVPDMNIPQTVKEIQESVKGYIESIAEIPVGEVKVAVMDIASGTKLRVE